ncbi:helix-turn-helix domain-containing protein [Hungatella sp.]|uniref:helix-turn-helix domain-containing protein n=1 Tax=Hungatella TaxID=1649459 RepID=UPI0011DDF723|nr:helix-turn-helix transcriptional regulator [Hungatella hathewayi]
MILERLRDLREDKDLAQQNIADYLHINQRTYSRYENDQRMIPYEVLSALADLYETSVDYLIGRTNVRKPYPKSKKK